MPARFEETSDSRRSVPASMLDLDMETDNTSGGRFIQRATLDDVCITGFSGRLPESSNIEEFKKNLFEGVDMVNDDARRWPAGLYDLPSRVGKIKDDDLKNLDAQFFKLHQKQGNF